MPDPNFQPLDFRTAPLEGTVLVEASAGTGKTWTIAALVVRLLLERRFDDKPCGVEDILVVTYTKAATAELRDRILAKLVEVRDGLAAGESADAVVRHALEATVGRREDAIAQLDLAIASFDLAPIHTIHGFCQRALAEHAFESASPFAAEVLEDETRLREAVAQDFWRRELAAATPARAESLLARFKGPAELLAAARPALDRAYADVVGVDAVPDEDALRMGVMEAFERSRQAWLSGRADITRSVAAAKLNGRSYPPGELESWWAAFDAYFAATEAAPLPEKLVKLTPAELRKGKTKSGSVPEHPFFGLVATLVEASDALDAAREAAATAFVQRFCAWSRSELARRKRERGLLSYDDLLQGLLAALEREGGAELAQALRSRYKAALIDEFQDTDPVQTAILARIWHGSGQPMYLVGDPKQAIYGFRGADVFAYLEARAAAATHLTLDVNQRADAPLLDAVAACFGDAGAFLVPEIELVPVRATSRARPRLVIEDDAKPFTVWHVPSRKGVAKEAVRESIAAAVADDIARLLALADGDRARLQHPDGTSARLSGGEIAVLVGTHAEGDTVRAALAARRIASVTYGANSVYESRESVEMERLLLALAEPGREALLRAALATDFFGLDVGELASLAVDGSAWEDWVARFRTYHDLARTEGFVRMWRALSTGEDIPARLLAHPDGDRRMTNVAHLVELLHGIAQADGLDLAQLARALAHARSLPMRDPDAEQLRLESDEHLVNIVTIHRAKGLEFAVVYCPFLWDGRQSSGRAGAAVFHSRERGWRTRVDLGSQAIGQHRKLAAMEELAGDLRLAYVALTRARHRCVMAWGALPDAGTSALAWLLHAPATAGDDPLAALKAAFKGLDDAAIGARLEALVAAGRGSIGVSMLPAATPASVAARSLLPNALRARTFAGRVAAAWRVSSFSGLVSRAASEAPDHDPLGVVAPAPRAAERRDAFGLPRGVRVGTLLHAILERLDFEQADPARIDAAVASELPASGVDAAWRPVIVQLVADVLATPLDARGFTLGALPRSRRIDEMEFTYPVGEAAAADLARVLAPLRALGSRIPESIGSLVLAPARGFMRGFVDLVFERDGRYFIADYKSNWLGDALADYAPQRLELAMRDAFYDLQALVYAVALHRFLGARLSGYDYERHFGGVYYLFLRGMQPAHGSAYGVHYDRPAPSLLEALDACLRPSGPLVFAGGSR